MCHIIGQSDSKTCCIGGNWTETWSDSDGVVDWSPSIILWRLPLHCEGHTVPTILLNSGGGSVGRGGESYNRGIHNSSTYLSMMITDSGTSLRQTS